MALERTWYKKVVEEYKNKENDFAQMTLQMMSYKENF